MNRGPDKMLAAIALFALGGLWGPMPALAATPAPMPTSTTAPQIEQLQELDEVVVHGTRLYDRIVRAEDRFYKLYNEINKDDDFDINCAHVSLDPETRIEDRVCMPSFFTNSIVESFTWSERCRGTQDEEGNYVPPPPCYTPPPPELVLMHRSDELARNMMAVIHSDPRLGDMAGELDELHLERNRLQRRYLELRADQEEARPEVKYRPRIR